MSDVLWIPWAVALARVRQSKNCDAERAGAILFDELRIGRLGGAGETSLECPAANTAFPEPAPDWQPQFIEQGLWRLGKWLPSVPALKLPDRVISNLHVDDVGLATLVDALAPTAIAAAAKALRKKHTAPQGKFKSSYWDARFALATRKDQEHEMNLAYEIALAKDEAPSAILNKRMKHRDNLARLHDELAHARARIDAWVPPFSATTAAQEQSVVPAKDDAPVATGEGAAPPRRRAGRPAEWGWGAAMAHLTAIANSPDSLPDVQADAERMVEKYFADRNDGRSPALSAIREKVSEVYDAVAHMREQREQGRKSTGRL
jgi:hypothetical protein